MDQVKDRLSLEAGLEEANRLIRMGRVARADRYLRRLATDDPKNAQVLGLRGIVALQAGDKAKAADLLSRSLSGHGPASVIRRNIQALLTVAISQQSEPLIEKALERPVPVDDAKFRQGPDERQVIVVLAEQLALIGRIEQALAVLEPFMPQLSVGPRYLELFGALKLAANEPEAALGPLKAAFRRGEPTSRLLLNLGAAAARTGEKHFQRTATTELVNRFPVYVTEQKASQTTTIGVVTWAPGQIKSRQMIKFHFPGNFISQLAKRHQDKYRLVSVLCNSPRALQAIDDAPRPDVVYNAIANSESIQLRGLMGPISQLVRTWDRPVINHPEKVLRSNRLSAPKLYAGLDNWLIPKIAQYEKDGDPADLADRIEAEFDYPVIIRGLVEQLGKNMTLVETRADLLEAVSNFEPAPFFYVIQYYESRCEDGLFRKIRAAIAGDMIQVIKVDYSTDWKVHSQRTVDSQRNGKHVTGAYFFAKYPATLDEEIDICRDVDSYFGKPVMDALRAFRSKSPLDVFGIDFDVMADGRLLFFEANSSMKLISTLGITHPDMPPYPEEAEDAFLAKFDRYLESLKETNPMGGN